MRFALRGKFPSLFVVLPVLGVCLRREPGQTARWASADRSAQSVGWRHRTARRLFAWPSTSKTSTPSPSRASWRDRRCRSIAYRVRARIDLADAHRATRPWKAPQGRARTRLLRSAVTVSTLSGETDAVGTAASPEAERCADWSLECSSGRSASCRRISDGDSSRRSKARGEDATVLRISKSDGLNTRLLPWRAAGSSRELESGS